MKQDTLLFVLRDLDKRALAQANTVERTRQVLACAHEWHLLKGNISFSTHSYYYCSLCESLVERG